MNLPKISLPSLPWKEVFAVLVVLLVLAAIAAVVWFIFWVHFVDNYEFGFVYDKVSGQVTPLGRTGWIVRTPIRYKVHAIDIRPYQVSISANARILNAKLVRFNPVGLETFVAWHGRDAGDKVYNLQEILKCYAFDRDEGRDCPFLDVVGVLAPSQSPIK